MFLELNQKGKLLTELYLCVGGERETDRDIMYNRKHYVTDVESRCPMRAHPSLRIG